MIKQGPANLESLDRQRQCVELRKWGYSYAEIGDQLGIDRSTAWHHVNNWIKVSKEELGESADKVRSLELERLDQLTIIAREVAANNKIGSAQRLKATETELKINARRSALLGLDAPTKVKLEVPTDHLSQLQRAAADGDTDALEACKRIAVGTDDPNEAYATWLAGKAKETP